LRGGIRNNIVLFA